MTNEKQPPHDYNALLSPMSLSISTSAPRFPRFISWRKHPHMLPLSSSDRLTRFLRRRILNEKSCNYLRDMGHFRNISDGLAFGVGVPCAVMANPISIPKMLIGMTNKLNLEFAYYTRHDGKTGTLHIFTPKMKNNSDKILFFVHGGAWGSGTPALYISIAHFFLLKNVTFSKVVVLGYEVYPEADMEQQTDSVASALSCLTGNVVLMGHSSGAHIALLAMVRLAQWRVSPSTIPDRMGDRSRAVVYSNLDSRMESDLLRVCSFVGLSGPYDISDHFDYEAAR